VVDVLSFLALLMVLGVVFACMPPETRERLRHRLLASLRQARHEGFGRRPESVQFRDALRARTRWATVTPILIALNVTVFVLMLWGPGTFSDPATLTEWGGNFWLRTRNGEWWRLVTSMFVHIGMLQLLVNVAALASIGLILERLVGRVIVATVFVTAGVFASLVNLTTHPMATSVGASGAVFGLYGLLLASSIRAIGHRSSVTIPLTTVKMLLPAAAVFILYNLTNDSLGSGAELTGLLAGVVCGAVLTKDVNDQKPAAGRVAPVAAAAIVIAVLSAIPLSGIADVKPELERTTAAEDRMAGAYRTARERFKTGRMTAEALALLIDRTIIPDLRVTSARLKALAAVPEEHQPLVANAEEYVRLRSESWRLRSEWLRKSSQSPRRGSEAAQYSANQRTIGQAEEKERAALEVLETIRPAVSAEPAKN
jgi:membrane associated rhomboid family serine protease